jgi:hypothetical protein
MRRQAQARGAHRRRRSDRRVGLLVALLLLVVVQAEPGRKPTRELPAEGRGGGADPLPAAGRRRSSVPPGLVSTDLRGDFLLRAHLGDPCSVVSVMGGYDVHQTAEDYPAMARRRPPSSERSGSPSGTG